MPTRAHRRGQVGQDVLCQVPRRATVYPAPGLRGYGAVGPCQDRLPIVNLGNLNPNSLNDVPLHDVMHPQLLCCICPFAYLVRPPCLETPSPNGNMWACSRPTRHEGQALAGQQGSKHHHVPRSDVSHTLHRLPTCTWFQTSPHPIVKLCSSAAPTVLPVFSESVMHRIPLQFTTAISCRCSARGTADSNKSYISLMRSGEAELFPIAVAPQP